MLKQIILKWLAPHPGGNKSRVLKSATPGGFAFPTLFSPPGGKDNVIAWPVDPENLFTLYLYSAEHSRAIHIKAEGCFGRGMEGDGAEKLDGLTQAGVADLFTQLGVDIETYGNAFVEIVRDSRKAIRELRRIPARSMWRNADERRYTQINYTPQGNIDVVDFAPEEIMHLRYACPAGTYYALPQWVSSAGMIELIHAAVRFNQQFFSNKSLPEYALITKGQQLSETQLNTVQDFFRREFQSLDNAHKTLYLHLSDDAADLRFEKLTGDNKDGDFLKLLDAARDRIPIAHGVPPRMLGIVTAGSLGAGSEVAGQLHVFEEYTLKPRRRMMRDLLRPLLSELGIAPEAIRFVPTDTTPEDVAEAQQTDALGTALEILKAL
jgi:HK97 family phage portal protein